MKPRKALTNLVRVIADEADRNPDFERRIAEALGLKERDAGTKDPTASASQRPKNRRAQPVLDPVDVVRAGENELRARLSSLSIDQLKDIVAEFGMDPGKLVIKWKSADRIIDRIVGISVSRAQKGDAFRSET